jgi:phosphopantothenoylcysteine decarboxylase/phosphopantothenate--cysteine ligase
VKILITAGPTHEPIDAVRYISNRSSGRMGLALCSAALDAGHHVTAILGPVEPAVPPDVRRIDVQTAEEMHAAVLAEFPRHDLLIMAAAVADFRPVKSTADKMVRAGKLTIECEATPDILAAAGRSKRSNQRTVGFSLESAGNLARSREKLIRKNLDLIVYNPIDTMNSATIESVLLWPSGEQEVLASRSKSGFAAVLIARSEALWRDEM